MKDKDSQQAPSDPKTDEKMFLDYPFSSRARRVMERLAVRNFLELSQFSGSEVLRGWGCGKRTFLEIRDALASVGLELAACPPYQMNDNTDRLDQLRSRQAQLEFELQQVKQQIQNLARAR